MKQKPKEVKIIIKDIVKKKKKWNRKYVKKIKKSKLW